MSASVCEWRFSMTFATPSEHYSKVSIVYVAIRMEEAATIVKLIVWHNKKLAFGHLTSDMS